MSARFLIFGAILLLVAIIIAGCGQGSKSDKPPIHFNPNMDDQEKYKAQSESHFFADGATMRPQVEGTVARGQLREDAPYYFGKDERGEYITSIPVEITPSLMERGEQRFNIFCSPCHGKIGDGKSIMVEKKFTQPPSFHTDSVRTMQDGYIFEVVTKGVRNMPSYAHQIGVNDRWVIIAYLRQLQETYKDPQSGQ
jgi:hypothetical protein